MKEIICKSKKYGNQIAFVDDTDFEKVNQYRWSVLSVKLKNGTKFYAQCNKLKIRMHQFILKKARKGYVIDHINGNSLDNRRENLREATLSQQNQNKASKNEYLGVSWNENNKKYQCHALKEYIGLFDDEKSAAIEYDKYIIRKLGKLGSRLNFDYNTPEQVESIKLEKCPVETRKQEKENRELPSNICLRENNTYRVQFRNDNFKKCKTLKTLELAIKFREECLKQIETIKEEQKQEYYLKPIIRNKEGIAFIPIEYEDKEYECLVDDDKWHDLTYNMSWRYGTGYALTHLDKTGEYIQRYLYKKYLPKQDISNLKIDHINRNPLDNRMSNLEPVTDGVNRYNVVEPKNKWGYRGVSKNRKKFQAEIVYKGKKYRTSGFETVEEAALAYNELSNHYYKHRAFQNEIK